MQQRIYIGATVDVARLQDAFEALGMVDGLDVVHTAPAREDRRGAGKGRSFRQHRRSQPVHNSAPATPSHPYADDPRAVMLPNGRINVRETLATMGLSAAGLMGMPTKRGTLEYSVKRSLMNNQREVGKGFTKLREQLSDQRKTEVAA